VAATAADRATRRGHWVAAADMATRITWAAGLAAGRPTGQLIDTVYRLVGTGLAAQESVPAAFAVAAAHPDDPWLACRIAASLGGDCDTIAAMAGAICGAGAGAGAFPEQARATVTAVNHLDLEAVAAGLLTVRRGMGDHRPRPAAAAG
jgi:ADP-ribosylglycohydrolase